MFMIMQSHKITNFMHYLTHNPVGFRFFWTNESFGRINTRITAYFYNIILQEPFKMISALNKFKETAIGKAAVAVVAAPLLIGAFAGAANAGDGKIAYHKFKSDRTPDFMNLAAATASTGRYALFVTGSNDVVLREVYKLALHIEKTTPYEVFFLHSNRSGPISDINLLVNGQIVTEVEVGGNIAEMKQALNQGFRTGSERLAKAETPKDPDVS